MINPKEFTQFLIDERIDHFFGVPDSFLKSLIHEFQKHHHQVFPNEGGAIAHACGHYLATNSPAVVYMQNSGLGNALNPLLSSAHKLVYGIPMLIFIGWRGESGIHDEPQHLAQGENLLPMLASLKIPNELLSSKIERAKVQIKEALSSMQQNPEPWVFVVKKDTFETTKTELIPNHFKINRTDIIKRLHKVLPEAIFIATTGHTARELYQIREELELSHANCFYNTGAMGHVVQIALAIAKKHPEKKVILLEGDGSMAMHLGNYLNLSNHLPANLKIICFNNTSHLSVGGQATAWAEMDITKVIAAMGIPTLKVLKQTRSINKKMNEFAGGEASFLEIMVENLAASNLLRPNKTHGELKKEFMDKLLCK